MEIERASTNLEKWSFYISWLNFTFGLSDQKKQQHKLDCDTSFKIRLELESICRQEIEEDQ